MPAVLTAVLASEPLRASLSDLLSAESKGKWWMVGAGWAGNPLVEKPLNKPVVAVTNEEEALLEMARKQGMNTDVRRSVFLILLTSEVRSRSVFELTTGLHARL